MKSGKLAIPINVRLCTRKRYVASRYMCISSYFFNPTESKMFAEMKDKASKEVCITELREKKVVKIGLCTCEREISSIYEETLNSSVILTI